ncbi:cyclin-dependent kinase inhibitor 1C-like [Bombyx mandarina]|uniref:Cyclin-dependent kinase inhibitor 1C-like n=1 Tax=Bombyx mandarina TaxID=7092 RepID=A0A6J2KA00_BOMMA|nr:cyclin-dependent kinase inhibitor 1C-like [Bombyx mandarina]
MSPHRVRPIGGHRRGAPYKRGTPGQCHRCQLYGHSTRNCNAARCVKCLGDHATIDCSRVKEIATEPPSCVLCRKQGHTANYGGRPKAPRKRPANAPPKTVGPKTSAPRAPKPAFVSAPVPTVSAWAKPLPFTKAGTPPAPQPRYAPQPLLAPRPAHAPGPAPAPAPAPRAPPQLTSQSCATISPR